MFPSPPQRTFRDSLTRRIAAGLLFFPVLAWGIYDQADSGEFDRLIWEFIVVAGALFGFVMVQAMGRRISIHQEGISYVSLFRQADLTWEEITSTRYQQQSADIAAHSDLLLLMFYVLAEKAGFMVPSLWITGRQTIRIGTGIRDGHEAIELVLRKVDSRLRPEADRFLASGASVSFGRISLSPEGVAWRTRAPIPWSEIVACRLEGRRLRIRRQGKFYDSIVVRTKKIPNLFVLMELIECRMSAPAGLTASESFLGHNR
jgi:hypothetical protein